MRLPIPLILLALFITEAEARGQEARQFCAPASIAPLADRPVRSVREFGAIGDGATDDSAALQAALNGVLPGTVLEFPTGTYAFSRVLTLSRNDVVLRGSQATLQARTPEQQALIVRGDRAGIVGLTLKGAATKRLLTLESAQLVIAGRWVQAVGNTVSGGASAGIFVDGARDFRVAGNHVFTTKADGIHVTNGARDGLVEGNLVHETGDDLIAVVSYRPATASDSQLARNILIENNEVWGNTWGRGITVVGGENVAIIGNSIRRIPAAAGIYLAQERSYRTYGDRHITVANNVIGDIQTKLSPSGAAHPRHGAIDINTSNEAPVEFIDVENNVVDGAGFAGIRLLGEVCHVRLANNTLKSVRRNGSGRPIDVVRDLFHGGCAGATLRCQGNTNDGKALAGDDRCNDTVAAEWRDASDQRTAPQGVTWASCVPP
ncbi:MAG: right-handed parallel beta-helix repeat-containing protein [Bacteroidota bacterium]